MASAARQPWPRAEPADCGILSRYGAQYGRDEPVAELILAVLAAFTRKRPRLHALAPEIMTDDATERSGRDWARADAFPGEPISIRTAAAVKLTGICRSTFVRYASLKRLFGRS